MKASPLSPDTRLIRRAITASGLSRRQWAEHIAQVDERTLRRWLAGKHHPPARILRLAVAELDRAHAKAS